MIDDTERRHEYLKIQPDLQEIKSSIRNIEKLLNGNGVKGVIAKCIDFEEYIKSASKWRLATLGIVFTLICNIVIATYGFGKLVSIVAHNKEIIHEIKNGK